MTKECPTGACKMRQKCYPEFNYKSEKCLLCYDRNDCMVEYYRRREQETQKKQKYHREPGEEVCFDCLGNKPPHCLGTFMNDEYCEECPHILDCKETTSKATGEKIRDTGKYKGKGKQRKKDIA